MSSPKGIIALMGSGELTTSMVEVHKEILKKIADVPTAVFLDTPAGFQLNADEISKRAEEYFKNRIQYPMITASFKSDSISSFEMEKAYITLKGADFIMIGPGSPTYAVSQWQGTLIPDIFISCVEKGGCLVAASAAALTIGRFTLPVYEIYKVGKNIHWQDGLSILLHFGLNAVVIPHWNNAEGGTHDTRFCYMGQSRFEKLLELLPSNIIIIGLDEHTACLLDFEADEARIRGIGRVTIYFEGKEKTFSKGDKFSLEILREAGSTKEWKQKPVNSHPVTISSAISEKQFWERIHAADKDFNEGLEELGSDKVIRALLEVDEIIWKAKQDLESEEFISQAREILRERIVLLGLRLVSASKIKDQHLIPLVDGLLDLRKSLRLQKRWQDADQIRNLLLESGINVEDTESGSSWYFK